MYFSPSNSDAGERELYMKLKRAKRDISDIAPHQSRWQALGTSTGDWLQYDLLLAENHYEKLTGKKPRFVVERVNKGYPCFEDFVHKRHEVNYDGVDFALVGTCDGILIDTVTGQRIGLEIKTKQETPSKTSLKSMKEADVKHIKQVVCYAEMYNLDKYLIIYYNCAKKKWFMTEDEFKNTPDIRVFEIDITDKLRKEVLGYLANVVQKFNSKQPPQLELNKWVFNNFKEACAKDLSDNEIKALETYVSRFKKSSMAAWEKQAIQKAYEDVLLWRAK